MRFLVTNDDGMDAPGLAALAEVARAFGDVVVAAPRQNWSVCSHRVTTDAPLRAERLADDRWVVDGTPADCVRLAWAHLAPEFDWVLSGMNHGGNLGADVHHSGTVAAVREASLLGRPGIALSHYRKRGMEIDWPRAADWMRQAIERLLGSPPARDEFWNVNLPHLRADEPAPRLVECPLDANPLPIGFRREGDAFVYSGNYHGRERTPGSDVDVCFSGHVALSRLRR